MSYPVIVSPQPTTDLSRPYRRRDALMNGDNLGVQYACDLAFPWCYAGAPVANGQLVKDLTGNLDGVLVVGPGQTIAAAGGGLDFSAVTVAGSYVSPPSAAFFDLSGAQQFLLCLYVRLPAQADWNTSSSLAPFFSTGSNAQGFNGDGDFLSISQSFATGSPTLDMHRQTAVGVADAFSLTPLSGDFGGFAQIAAWNSGIAEGFRLRTPNGIQISQFGAGGKNLQADAFTQAGKFGIGVAFWASVIAACPSATRWRAYRMWVEDLNKSGRDPLTVLDADWTRVTARAAFS